VTLARTQAIALAGLDGSIIDIEVDVSNGLPTYSLLGLPDATLTEARDRIRAAIINSGFRWPNQKVTVSLSPAWLPKSGSSFDLPIALTILVASGQLDYSKILDYLFVGELSLEGSLRSIRGLLPILIAAKRQGIQQVIVPAESINEEEVVSGLKISALSNLKSVVKFLSGELIYESPKMVELEVRESVHDLSEVAGHRDAKFALEVLAAGRHNLLMIGPPGTGKTMLAERIPSILPPLSKEESIDVAGIHSIAGMLKQNSISATPPFIAPHHATTIPALVGGGSGVIKPGACSLAHNGILFIDEAPECGSGILDALRQPMESGQVTISRANSSAIFPARFILVLAANPCPCGKFSGRGRGCQCSSLQVRRYLGKLSGPLLDRIDIRIRVDAPSRTDLADQFVENSSAIRARVIKAREIAKDRFSGLGIETNSKISPNLLRSKFRATKDAMVLLSNLLDREVISARSFHRLLRVAWSIADLKNESVPGKTEVEQAISLRSGLDYE
jgi:magnesium chelatase family protein